MGKRDGHQKGPQQHAEGQHGKRTHAAFIDGLHGSQRVTEEPEQKPAGRHKIGWREGDEPERRGFDSPEDGRHRLVEDRQQHDEAEKNSEKTRHNKELAFDAERPGSTPDTKGSGSPGSERAT